MCCLDLSWLSFQGKSAILRINKMQNPLSKSSLKLTVPSPVLGSGDTILKKTYLKSTHTRV